MSSRFSSILAILLGVLAVVVLKKKDSLPIAERDLDNLLSKKSNHLNHSSFERENLKHHLSLEALIEQYGKERVEHAQRIFPSYIQYVKRHLYIDPVFESRPHAVLVVQSLVDRKFGVELAANQEERAIEAFHQLASRTLTNTEMALSKLESDPEYFLEFVLSSDARVHAETTEEEFTKLQYKYATIFDHLYAPPHMTINRERFWAQRTGDSILRCQIEALLTPEQIEAYRMKIARDNATPEDQALHGYAACRAISMQQIEMNLLYSY